MESVVTIVIIALMVIGWISNLVNENKANPPKRQGGGQRKQPNLQAEIENFLKEVKQQNPQQQQQEPEPPPRREPISQQRERQQQRPQVQSRTSSSNKRESQKQRSTQQRRKTRQPLKDQPPHKSQIDQRKKKESIKDHHLESSIATPKKQRRPVHQPAQSRPAKTGNFAVLLRSPANVRNAIVVNEILQPPLSMRKKG